MGKRRWKRPSKPNMDYLAQHGAVGMARTVPEGMPPGSDTANLSVMGYAPEVYYSGRSPLEAVSMGVPVGEEDVTLRMNLVTLSDEENFADKTMIDYSAGEIETQEAVELVALSGGAPRRRAYTAVSRHQLPPLSGTSRRADGHDPYAAARYHRKTRARPSAAGPLTARSCFR